MLALMRRLLGRLAETFCPVDLFDCDFGDLEEPFPPRLDPR